MRERIAIGISVLVIGVLATLSLTFARSQNRLSLRDVAQPAAALEATAPIPASTSREAAEAADSARGRVVFREQTCERCHSVAGVGSPRYPLDGVGSRRTQAELRAWTIAADVVADSLSPSAARAKRGYAELPAADMNALLRYLASLR
jgi:mono/diheme cytochrome c family protein